MTATTLDSARSHGSFRDRLRERGAVETWALPLILAVATFDFFYRLGASSLFTDEAFSIIHSLPSFHTMFHVIGRTETTPYTYFLFLHEWMIRTGSQAAWAVRFPSAVAGVALVWAVYWLAGAFVDRRAALAAAALTAISPLIVSYAQEARVYIFLMLAVVVMAAATVRAVQRTDGRMPLLVLGAVAAVVAIWLHYTALSVIVPLAIWLCTRGELRWRERAVFLVGSLAALLTVLPLLIEQYHYNPKGGDINGSVNLRNILSVVGTPFGSRVGTPIDFYTVLGALVVIVALVVLLASHRERVRERRLLAALGAFGVIGLFLVDLAGNHIMITRYTTATAPFLVLVIVAACVELRTAAGAVLATVSVALAVAGVIHNHSPSGFYAPVRQTIRYIQRREHPNDFVISPGFPLTDTPIFYYDTRFLKPKLKFLGMRDPGDPVRFRHHQRIWIIDNPPSATRSAALALIARRLRRFHYHVVEMRIYTTSITLAVILTAPDAHPRAGRGRTVRT